MADYRILTVCTANICRSPLTAALIQDQLNTAGLGEEAGLRSAGVSALAEAPACAVMRQAVLPPGDETRVVDSANDTGSGQLTAVGLQQANSNDGFNTASLVSQPPAAYLAHQSAQLTPADLQEADLVIALDRSHSGAIARMAPSVRPRVFTLRQAAGLASTLRDTLAAGRLPEGAPALPATLERNERFSWFVAEMDAGRGLTKPLDYDHVSRTAALGLPPIQIHDSDVPDPHVTGMEYHPLAIELIDVSVRRLVEGLTMAMRVDIR